MKFNKRKWIKLRNWLHRKSALAMAMLIFIEVSYPTQMMALTGGPSQPEVQSFEPIGTSDMVDMFSGDFNYNIPLLDVEGYPINIGYHAGINTDQEASWVGLGWNINPGVINRNMRGIPDDFAGENITKKFNMKPNMTWGVAIDGSAELFGNEKFSIGVGASLGFNFNNYTGPSITKSFNVNVSAGLGAVGKLNAGLGLTSSSDEGLTVQPSIGFSAKINTGGKTETSLGVSIGTAFNSRGGLKQLSISTSAAMSVKGDYVPKIVESAQKSESGATMYEDAGGSKASGSLGSHGASGTFDFGQPTYTPKIDMPMRNFSMSGHFSLGGEVWGFYGKIGLSGFYSAQELATTTLNNPAYGYMYSEKGQMNDNALMDYNREKDGTFTDNTPSLPLTNSTFDTYGVSGQGVGGSYRPFRGDIGYVFDASSYTTNDDDALSLEVGIGGYVHAGGNVTLIDVLSKSGKWKDDNDAINALRYTEKGDGNDFENFYFKEANEKTVESDPSFYQTVGRDKAVRFDVALDGFSHQVKNGFVDENGSTTSYSGPIKRKKRDKRTQNISFLKYDEYSDFATDDIYIPQLSTGAKAHHLAEVTTLGIDGARYVYGIAAYNTYQKEITFSVGSTVIDTHNNGGSLNNCASQGLVAYGGSDNSLTNGKGIDNYYSSTETPAYAHSYLLTAVLTPDYIDADGKRGPSDGDFGGYTRFAYKKISDFNWRTPVGSQQATFNEGLKSDYTDDKANIIYGTKDLYYLDSVITKNYFAVFHKSNRQDGFGVADENGAVNTGKALMRLDSISLYSKRDLSAPVKRVHFVYSYNLCTGITNSSSSGGKLTLDKIYFSYRNSNKARLSPYIFYYDQTNPTYNIKAYNRWGGYKPNNAGTIGVIDPSDVSNFINSGDLPPSDYPYVEQDRTTEDLYAAAWSLKEIDLPSGGRIKVTYESDDYAYVQNRKAGQMFKIINYVANPASLTSGNVDKSNTPINFSNPGFSNPDGGYFVFKANQSVLDPKFYKEGLKYVYFRFLVNIRTTQTPQGSKKNLEYVSGYGEFQNLLIQNVNGTYYGCLRLKDVNLRDDNLGTSVNPVIKTGVNFGRLHLPKKVWDATAGNFSGSLSKNIVSALINSSFIKNIRDAAAGPSQSLYSFYDVSKSFVGAKSWVRLNNPDGHKLGGGHRVKKIEMIDNWQAMLSSATNGETSTYGQEYTYNLDNGISSGVASYEPQLGGDENPFKQPIFSSTKKLMVPDDESYVEEPFGESFFPSPSVGYSKVTVKNIQRANVVRHATGKVVHEFYTAKDFPTITSRTGVMSGRGKDDPLSIKSLLKIDVKDYFAASQGFVIELNDMHGKPKSQTVYQEGQIVPISSVEYKYKCQSYLNGGFKLTNDCKTIEKNGTIATNNIGMFFDLVGDFRESKTNTDSKTTAINCDVIPIWGLPIPIPGIWPGFAKSKTRFRSATLTKVVQRFGILEETIARDLGSVVSTKNLAYDAQTGDVLLTQTTTDFNDKIYSFKYPAWWYYDLMGPSYSNLGFEQKNVNIIGGGAMLSTASYYKEGDEVILKSPGNNLRGWVYNVTGSLVTFMLKDGSPASGLFTVKVVRSGKRNNLTTTMANITTLTDPLSSLSSNAYQNVLQASAVEFSNKRKTHCDCINSNAIIPATSNPYVAGTTGWWRPLKSYTHLTSRTQANTNDNTNIRRDGTFGSYTPFYKLSGGSWQITPANWTYVSNVSEFNAFAQEVENQDALNRYSSASFGYNQTQALSVAANAQYKEQGFDGFEDYSYNPCADDHFKLAAVNDLTSLESHTGKKSMVVKQGLPKTYTKAISLCVPASNCNLTLTSTYNSNGYTNNVVPGSGTAPYSYYYSVLSGSANNPQCVISGNNFVSTATGPYVIKITAQDAKGCQKSIIVSAN